MGACSVQFMQRPGTAVPPGMVTSRIETNSTRFTCVCGQRHFFWEKLKYVLETFFRDM